ncbi:hypothetical protein, partial [Salmonella enterica]|uniref:hypothetical protein n=1 Tax=Salmonella enterica TaxID=28901 RepID=UPI0015CA8AA2
KLSDGFDQATHDLPPGGKLEVGAEVEAGEGVELVGRTKIEVENTGHGWEVARTIGGEVAAGVHAGGIFEGKAGIAFDVTEHYEYS